MCIFLEPVYKRKTYLSFFTIMRLFCVSEEYDMQFYALKEILFFYTSEVIHCLILVAEPSNPSYPI